MAAGREEQRGKVEECEGRSVLLVGGADAARRRGSGIGEEGKD